MNLIKLLLYFSVLSTGNADSDEKNHTDNGAGAHTTPSGVGGWGGERVKKD